MSENVTDYPFYKGWEEDLIDASVTEMDRALLDELIKRAHGYEGLADKA